VALGEDAPGESMHPAALNEAARVAEVSAPSTAPEVRIL
jgi:hypothetical protein